MAESRRHITFSLKNFHSFRSRAFAPINDKDLGKTEVFECTIKQGRRRKQSFSPPPLFLHNNTEPEL